MAKRSKTDLNAVFQVLVGGNRTVRYRLEHARMVPHLKRLEGA